MLQKFQQFKKIPSSAQRAIVGGGVRYYCKTNNIVYAVFSSLFLCQKICSTTGGTTCSTEPPFVDPAPDPINPGDVQ